MFARHTVLGVMLVAGAAAAQARTRVDFHQGPVVSSGRVIGLGGAYIAVAEGADAQIVNPAAYAIRPAHAVDDWFDWDVALSWFNIGAKDDIDLDQSGRGAFEDAQLLQLGFNLKFGRHGFGLLVAQQAYRISRQLDESDEALEYGQLIPSIGYAYAWDEWTFGAAIIGSNAQIKRPGQEPFARLNGGGLLLGAVYHHPESPWRFGATLRSRTVGAEFEGDAQALNDLVPEEIVLPWSLSFGVARMWGERTFNPRARYGAGEPTPRSGRRYLMVTADIVFTGPADQAIAAQAFLEADSEPIDIPASASLHAGVESEVFANRLVLRAGSYYEPYRPDPTRGRLHGTAGADLRFEWGWQWKLGTVIDVAPDYLNFGLGVGFWH